jgi:hypothetical protein
MVLVNYSHRRWRKVSPSNGSVGVEPGQNRGSLRALFFCCCDFPFLSGQVSCPYLTRSDYVSSLPSLIPDSWSTLN